MNKNIIIAILLVVIIAVGAAFVLGQSNGKMNTQIKILNNETFQNGEQVQIELKDSQGNALSGKTVNITYKNNEKYSITTDQSGKCYLTISGESAGKYEIEASFAGDDKYAACTTKDTITITDDAPDNVGTATTAVATTEQYNNNGGNGTDDGTYYIEQYDIWVRRSDNVIVKGPASVVGLTLDQFYQKLHEDFSKEENKSNITS